MSFKLKEIDAPVASRAVTANSDPDSADDLWGQIDEKIDSGNPSYAIALLPALPDPSIVFVKGGTNQIIEGIKSIARSEASGLDILNPKDRKKMASIVYQVARSKTAIDDAGKKLKKERMAGIDIIDAERKWSRESLEEFQEEIRKPLTDWENANKARTQGHYDALGEVSFLHQNRDGETVETVGMKLEKLAVLRARNWDEFATAAYENCDAVELALKSRLEMLVKARKDAEELEELRREAAARKKKEHEDRIAQEAAEKARKAAEEKAAQEAAALARKREQERIDAERKAKEEERQARLAEEERVAKIRREQEKAEREAQEERERARMAEYHRMAAEKRAKEVEEKAERDRIEAEERAKKAAAKAEGDRKAAEERAVEAERKRARAEAAAKSEADAKRRADEEHRALVRREIIAALAKSISENIATELREWEDAAECAYNAIDQGLIPHVRIDY
jgi:colicin import membrane protein